MMWQTEKDETREKWVAMQSITTADMPGNARLKRERAEKWWPAPCRAVRRARRVVKAVRCSKNRGISVNQELESCEPWGPTSMM